MKTHTDDEGIVYILFFFYICWCNESHRIEIGVFFGASFHTNILIRELSCIRSFTFWNNIKKQIDIFGECKVTPCRTKKTPAVN